MSALVPIARAVMESRDLAEVHDLFSRRYVEHSPRVVGDPRGFRFWSRSATAGDLTVDRAQYRARMAITTDPFESILLVSVLGGHFDVTAGRQHSRVGTGGSLLLPTGSSLDLIMDRTTQQVAQLPVAAFARMAARFGVDPVDFRFDAMTPISAAANRRWAATVTYLTRILSTPGDSGIHPLMLTAAVDAAATAALTAFPNSTMAVAYVAGPGPLAPAVIRRAVAYIDANAADPITLDHIAAAAGIGVRALQTGFRRHLDMTPVGYLRHVRLERAHRDLQAADPTSGDTVADVAYRWGFTNLGRFAASYRSAFGRRPSQTLHT
ncbi:AraC family transcriptional regulator [Paractinoplanes lichenicola]|uniref:AraC family transcriptional regulator n=1 Tax=Paractinoplanes lichenicola TaxID=2802976 RepID=A0ABS1VH84_9ACTN|nr:AraC family transcriptional regulator [Actinoplanes lichenicola]MBL7252796.1 AraC family transcriptional regulator [Actinoplanes lichenicola]